MDKNIILDFFFPAKCVFCGEIVKRGAVCSHCRTQVEHLAIPLHLQQINSKAFKNLDRCFSCYYYEGIVRKGLIDAKRKSGEVFSKAFLQYISFDFDRFIKDNDIDAIISMPCHKSKFYNREYDLPQLMVQAIAKSCHLEYNKDLVKKVKRTKNQHDLKLEQRKSNLKDAFAVYGDVKGRNILIIDDIVTSGNSLEEVARTLKKSGAEKVIAVTFAYNRL